MTRLGLLKDDTMSETMLQYKRRPRLKVLKQLIESGEIVKYYPFFYKREICCVFCFQCVEIMENLTKKYM